VAEGVYHAVHEYTDNLKNIYLDDFKNSYSFAAFCRRTGRDNISFSKFKVGALQCKCISKPTMRICVDEVETGFVELLNCLKNVFRTARVVCECDFCRLQAAREADLGAGKFCCSWCIP
jgi:hypothetical protein